MKTRTDYVNAWMAQDSDKEAVKAAYLAKFGKELFEGSTDVKSDSGHVAGTHLVRGISKAR